MGSPSGRLEHDRGDPGLLQQRLGTLRRSERPATEGAARLMPCVLIADDNRQFAAVLRASLEDAGFDVLTAYSGLAAVACVEQNEVAAAVLDVLMPGISGDAVAARLRQIDPKLPVALMTGGDDAFAAGTGFPVLRKPFAHEELVETLNRMLPSSRR